MYALLVQVAEEAASPSSTAWIVAVAAVGTVVSTLLGIGTLGRHALRALDRRISAQAGQVQAARKAADQAAAQTATTNGHSAGQLIESAAKGVDAMREEVKVLTTWAEQNRDLARDAAVAAVRADAVAAVADAKADRALEAAARIERQVEELAREMRGQSPSQA